MVSPLPALFSLLPYQEDLIVLLPRKVWKDEAFWLYKSLSVLQPDLYFLSYIGTSVCPGGDRDFRIRISLSNQGGGIKSSKVT